MAKKVMLTNEEEAWLVVDEAGDSAIVGNRKGLERLKEDIARVLDDSNTNVALSFQDSNINRIVLKSKKSYLGEDKETKGQKVIGLLLVIWFAILPFVAVSLIVYLAFFNTEKQCAMPLFNPLKSPAQRECVSLP